VAETATAALAGDEVGLELPPFARLQLVVQVAAQDEEAALHNAISR
jgi:hypothetical protein